MDSYSGHRCWEIINCDNLSCPARFEPETPCWEIAKRDEDYHNILNTCEDCIVYLLKVETSILNIKELQNLHWIGLFYLTLSYISADIDGINGIKT